MWGFSKGCRTSADDVGKIAREAVNKGLAGIAMWSLNRGVQLLIDGNQTSCTTLGDINPDGSYFRAIAEQGWLY